MHLYRIYIFSINFMKGLQIQYNIPSAIRIMNLKLFFAQNFVLIKDPEDARKFYPRFNLEDTSSFNDLDDHRYFLNA